MKLHELDELIKTVCPIDGICASPQRIDFKSEATPEQRAAAQALMDEHLGSVELWHL
jgi:hypothetical protein